MDLDGYDGDDSDYTDRFKPSIEPSQYRNGQPGSWYPVAHSGTGTPGTSPTTDLMRSQYSHTVSRDLPTIGGVQDYRDPTVSNHFTRVCIK